MGTPCRQHAALQCGSSALAILSRGGFGAAHRVSRASALLLGPRGTVVWVDARPDALGPRGVLVDLDALGAFDDVTRWRWASGAVETDRARLTLDRAARLQLAACGVARSPGEIVRDTNDLVAAACAMVGLGRGLTPAGDDLLGGFLMGARARGARHRALARAVLRAARGTVPVSRARLRDHARGLGTVAEARYVRAVAGDGSAHERTAALERLAALGHSSGRDFARGVDLALRGGGLRALCEEQVT